MLHEYLKNVQSFLREQKQVYDNVDDLIRYINRARREVAMRAQCIRVLTPSSGSIVGWSLTAQGSGYSSSPVLTITPPDFPSGQLPNPGGRQATASCEVVLGKIESVFSQDGGAGYFQPQMTITDVSGSGAVASPIMSYINTINLNQEVYPFSGINLAGFPGCKAVHSVRSISIIFANYRYSLPQYSFTTYQALIRRYPYQYNYVPTFCSQFGQGAGGSLYMYPLPSQTYQAEWDCLCIPIDLIDDLSVEAIPEPWTDAVPFYTAHLAMLEQQNLNAAKGYLDFYNERIIAYSNYARVGRMVNPYGRY